MNNKRKRFMLSAGSCILWILLWHIGASLANRSLLFHIPLPYETVKELFVCVRDLLFWKAVVNSLAHIISGFLFAVVSGLVCGILSGGSIIFKTLTSPIARLIRSVPVAAFIVLAWLWIPSSSIPAFIAFLMVFPIIWLQVESALSSIDPLLTEMAQVMGMSRSGIVKNIKIPSVLESFRSACITGLGFAWKSGVAAEVICNPTGSIGAMLSNAKSNLEYGRVFAVVFTIVILSFVLENIIKFFWSEKRHGKIQ